MVVLDFFAREGDWQTSYIAERVKKIHAWEVNTEFESNLIKNLPNNAVIQIGDSFEMARTLKNSNMFDMLIFDNPQGCYGDENEYCEHFEALHLMPALLRNPAGVVLVNVKTQPFNYEDKLMWQERRNNFYDIEDASNLSLEFVEGFYRNFYESIGYRTSFSLIHERPQESGLYLLTSGLEKV